MNRLISQHLTAKIEPNKRKKVAFMEIKDIINDNRNDIKEKIKKAIQQGDNIDQFIDNENSDIRKAVTDNDNKIK